MNNTPLTLELRPLHGGAYTHSTLRGPLATVPQPKELRRLMSVLWLWQGGAVDVVLCVDGTCAGSRWLEIWDEALRHVRARQRDLRFLISPETLAAVDD